MPDGVAEIFRQYRVRARRNAPFRIGRRDLDSFEICGKGAGDRGKALRGG
jgi:hypothetical protein